MIIYYHYYYYYYYYYYDKKNITKGRICVLDSFCYQADNCMLSKIGQNWPKCPRLESMEDCAHSRECHFQYRQDLFGCTTSIIIISVSVSRLLNIYIYR